MVGFVVADGKTSKLPYMPSSACPGESTDQQIFSGLAGGELDRRGLPRNVAGVGSADKLQVEHPRPAQHHRERPHTARAAGRRQIGAASEVDPGLLARAVSNRTVPCTGGRGRSGWTNSLRIEYPPVYPRSRSSRSRIWQFSIPAATCWRMCSAYGSSFDRRGGRGAGWGELWRPEILPDRVSGDAQGVGNATNGCARAVQLQQLLHRPASQHR